MAGGDVMNEDFTAPAVNTPEAARALDLWATLVKDGSAAPQDVGPTDDRFPTEQGAMFVSGYWVYGWIKDNYPEFLDKLGVAPIPAPSCRRRAEDRVWRLDRDGLRQHDAPG